MVILIIAILIAVALPTFLGARREAADRRTQALIRNGYAAAKAQYLEAEVYSDNAVVMEGLEPALTWVTGDTPAGIDNVYIHVHAAGPHEVFISSESTTGDCFYLHDVPSTGVLEYAVDSGCGVADGQAYSSDW